MGRKKIKIERITDERSRSVTFLKRKTGVFKKAMELSILCNCEVAMVIYDPEKEKVFQYTNSGNIEEFYRKYTEAKSLTTGEIKTNKDYEAIARQTERPKAKKRKLKVEEEDASKKPREDSSVPTESLDTFSSTYSQSGMMQQLQYNPQWNMNVTEDAQQFNVTYNVNPFN